MHVHTDAVAWKPARPALVMLYRPYPVILEPPTTGTTPGKQSSVYFCTAAVDYPMCLFAYLRPFFMRTVFEVEQWSTMAKDETNRNFRKPKQGSSAAFRFQLQLDMATLNDLSFRSFKVNAHNLKLENELPGYCIPGRF